MLNEVNLLGRLTADPELKTTQNGVSVTSFAIAVERDYSSNGEKTTDFIPIVAWRNTAEFVSKYFNKGKMIVVNGSIQVRNYTDKDGNKRIAVEVVADNVYFAGDKGNAQPKAPNVDYVPFSAPASGYSDYGEEIDNSDDLPF